MGKCWDDAPIAYHDVSSHHLSNYGVRCYFLFAAWIHKLVENNSDISLKLHWTTPVVACRIFHIISLYRSMSFYIHRTHSTHDTKTNRLQTNHWICSACNYIVAFCIYALSIRQYNRLNEEMKKKKSRLENKRSIFFSLFLCKNI